VKIMARDENKHKTRVVLVDFKARTPAKHPGGRIPSTGGQGSAGNQD